MSMPFIAALLENIMNLILGIAGNDPEVIKVFEALIAFFS